MTPDLPLARWLSNSRIGMRAPVLADARAATRWWIGPQPHDEETIARELRKRESIPWGGNPVLTLVAVSHADGEIVGGVVVTRSANRTSRDADRHSPSREISSR